MKAFEIDYSGIGQPISQVAQEEWEPPVHKYFGKKLPNGKTEKEPTYSYKEYPRMMYGLRDGTIYARVVNSDEEKHALGENWATNPIAFGYITAPSFEQIQEMRDAEEAGKDGSPEPVKVIVSKAPRRGRPPKAA